MKVSDVLLSKSDRLVCAPADAPLSRLLAIMVEARVGSIIITRPRSTTATLGIVTERSIIEEAAKKGPHIFSQSAHSLVRAPIPRCCADDSVSHAMFLMTSLRTRHLLVATGDDVPGLVSIGDLVKFRIRDTELENAVLRDLAAARILNA